MLSLRAVTEKKPTIETKCESFSLQKIFTKFAVTNGAQVMLRVMSCRIMHSDRQNLKMGSLYVQQNCKKVLNCRHSSLTPFVLGKVRN